MEKGSIHLVWANGILKNPAMTRCWLKVKEALVLLWGTQHELAIVKGYKYHWRRDATRCPGGSNRLWENVWFFQISRFSGERIEEGALYLRKHNFCCPHFPTFSWQSTYSFSGSDSDSAFSRMFHQTQENGPVRTIKEKCGVGNSFSKTLIFMWNWVIFPFDLKQQMAVCGRLILKYEVRQ